MHQTPVEISWKNEMYVVTYDCKALDGDLSVATTPHDAELQQFIKNAIISNPDKRLVVDYSWPPYFLAADPRRGK